MRGEEFATGDLVVGEATSAQDLRPAVEPHVTGEGIVAYLELYSTAAATLDAAREEFERRFIRAALATAQGRRSRAADALGISRQGLAKMMRRLRIDAP